MFFRVLILGAELNVIHTMPDIDKEASGPSYSVVRLCESLLKLGEQSSIALIGEHASNHFIHGFPAGLGPARLGNSPAMYRWLKQQLAGSTVDIVHNHSLWMLPNVYPGWATKGRAIPYVVSPRGTLSEWAMQSGSRVKRIYWPLIQRPAIAHASCFHATAGAEYEDIRKMGFRQPVAVIPNGIDLPVLGKRAVGPERTLLFLGRLHPVKGVDFLLRAWRILETEFPEWSLRVVGPTENETAVSLIELSKSLALKRVTFSGAVYGDDKFGVYQAADLYVLPTHSENFAVTVAEALACAKPVVVSQGAPWRGVEKHKAGWWPEIGELPLLQALRSAMSLPRHELAEMGENGRRWMQSDFSWMGISEKMLDTYRWLRGLGEKPSCVVID